MTDMDAAEARSSLGQTHQSHPPHRAVARPPLPVWVPPSCAVLFGAAVALQAPQNGMPGLTSALIGLALAIGAYALVTVVRGRQGARRRSASKWGWTAAVVCATALSTSSLTGADASEPRWLYVASGVAVAGIVWYRLQRNAPVGNRS
ncbi:hypothetical protein DDJ31_33175 [Streptomyces griseoviridis]|uniref:Transmembrane protein n=3 Tax=Streptomyces griseoviridis TaxID=45398 RepID=A0A6G5SPI0_STRGD|nr:hypothetical protein DDJ31_33175 [Streptomyces griseoviridis]